MVIGGRTNERARSLAPVFVPFSVEGERQRKKERNERWRMQNRHKTVGAELAHDMDKLKLSSNPLGKDCREIREASVGPHDISSPSVLDWN